jgi:hypothetical protein
MLSVGPYQLTLLALIGHKDNGSITAVESVLPAVRADLDHRICWILPVNQVPKTEMAKTTAASSRTDHAASLDRGNYLQAYVAAFCAMELAIARRPQKEGKTSSKSAFNSALQSFFDTQNTKSQIAIVLRLTGVAVQDIERVLKAVGVRNEAVHEGHRITDSEAQELRYLMKIVSQLLGPFEIKQSILSGANSLSAPMPQVPK